MKLAVLVPSRGLIHSRTIESIEQNLENLRDWEIKKFFSHDLPIPEAQNFVTQNAYDWGADLFCFVEEDNLIPEGTLEKMISSGWAVVAVDYPVGEKRCSTIAKKGGRIRWCGFGCTLIKREVFDKLEKPWFRTNKSYLIDREGNIEKVSVQNSYGGHDIDFGIRMEELGIPIFQLPDTITGHVKLTEWGKQGENDGFHKVDIWENIEMKQEW